MCLQANTVNENEVIGKILCHDNRYIFGMNHFHKSLLEGAHRFFKLLLLIVIQ